jgi:hypothetical protein
MNVYKFQDNVDGNYIFVLAKTQELAREVAERQTVISLRFIESRDVSKIGSPIVLFNNILPF